MNTAGTLTATAWVLVAIAAAGVLALAHGLFSVRRLRRGVTEGPNADRPACGPRRWADGGPPPSAQLPPLAHPARQG